MLSKDEIRKKWKSSYPKDEGQRSEASKALCQFIASTPTYENAKKIGLYSALPWELDVTPLFNSCSTRCSFPKIVDDQIQFYEVHDLNELSPGHAGILEPVENPRARIATWGPGDLILIPCLGLDVHGARIGSGRGYYDRYLASVACYKWGVGWTQQVHDLKLDLEPTDVRMDALCTEQGIREVPQS